MAVKPTITDRSRSVQIGPVKEILPGSIVADGDKFLRAFRFLGGEDANGKPVEFFEVVCEADTREALRIETPPFTY